MVFGKRTVNLVNTEKDMLKSNPQNSLEDLILRILMGVDKYPIFIPIKNEHEFQLCVAGIISQYGNLGWNIRTKDNTYIDLTLGDSIAIELKMNPDRNELNRLIGQCSNYLKWYRYLIVLILWDKTTILEIDTSILSKFVYFKHIRLNPIIINSTGQKQLVI